jgi:S-adenosylmethionine decarboxylase
MQPIPGGLHIIANFLVGDSNKLRDSIAFRSFVNDTIYDLKLCKVGEVYHDFPNGGYTAVVCLTESHLSVHTWPERNFLTFDIFLSNFLKDNSASTRHFYENAKKYFDAVVKFEQIVNR